MGQTHQETTTLELVNDERFVLFFRKKAEKMTAAVYFVTDLLSEREPLKWSLRDRCLGLFANVLSFGSKKSVAILKADVSDILSLLYVARSARVLSEMNGRLLEDVCRELRSLLDEVENKTKLTDSLFDVPRPQRQSFTKDQEQRGDLYETSTSLYDMSFKSSSASAPQQRPSKQTQQKSGSPVHKRKEQIVNVLKVKGTATIGDIKKVIEGVSDKTLQRDVTSLVEEGVLTKEGDRRWTTYSLV